MESPASVLSHRSSPQGSQSFCRSVLGSTVKMFLEKNPTAKTVINAIQTVEEEQISFDHLAFRTIGIDGYGIDSLESFFLDHGYTVGGELSFPAKKVRARWFAPPDSPVPVSVDDNSLKGPLPRVFVSELVVDQLSEATQEILKQHVKEPSNGNNNGGLSCALASSTWKKPLSAKYMRLAKENEYAAWTLVHGRALNHVALACHRMKSHLKSINGLNGFLEENGFEMNDEGGLLKVSPDALLLQSSTIAEKIPLEFADGVTESIPYGFVEFVERLVLPQYKDIPEREIQEIHRREGFEIGNANKIMESTRLATRVA